ncbi:hypothetical protein ABPG72_015969, partial [Tetrahymena utriculariae]
MGNKLSENIKQKCQQYNQNENDIIGLLDHLNEKGYQCLDIIGKGVYGVVLRAYSTKLNSEVAIKCLKIQKKQDFEKLKKECDIISKFKQTKYLLKSFDTFQVINKDYCLIFMVTELFQGDLSTLINSENKLSKLEIQKSSLSYCQVQQKWKTIKPYIWILSHLTSFFSKTCKEIIRSNMLILVYQRTFRTMDILLILLMKEGVMYTLAIKFQMKIDIILIRYFSKFYQLIRNDEGAFLRRDGIDHALSNQINDEFLADNIIRKMVTRHDMRDISQQLLFKLSNLLLDFGFGKIPDTIQINDIQKIQKDQLLLQDITMLCDQGENIFQTWVSMSQSTTSLDLDFKNRSIEAEEAQIIQKVIKNCQNLLYLKLDLSKRNIYLEEVENIEQLIITCLNLKIPQKKSFIILLFSFLCSEQICLKYLIYFSIKNQYNFIYREKIIQEEEIKNIQKIIEMCQNLTSLNLNFKSKSQLQTEALMTIQTMLEKNQNLKYLNPDIS